MRVIKLEKFFKNFWVVQKTVWRESLERCICSFRVFVKLKQADVHYAQVPQFVSALRARVDEAAGAGWWIRGGLSGQKLMIDAQTGYEAPPATPYLATAARDNLQNEKEELEDSGWRQFVGVHVCKSWQRI